MTYTMDTQNEARQLSARGTIIEAHANAEDQICRVIIELAASAEAVAHMWQEDGFIATITRDGLLIIDGLINAHPQADLMAAVSQQMKHYAMQEAHSMACADMTGIMPVQAAATTALTAQ